MPADPNLASVTQRGNAAFPWAQFDPEAYFQHYYGEPHPDDDQVTRLASAAIQLAPPLAADLDIIDVGTGPNLIPFLCALPRARSLTAWEYSARNISWLEQELAQGQIRPQWQHFWDIAREAHGRRSELPDDPIPLLRETCTVTHGSIFDLPKRRWDAASMFFCAESITEKLSEFEAACSAFARCVKPGGRLTAAFLVQSAGYEVAGRRFPALHLSAETIKEVFASLADSVIAQEIGIVDKEVRSGYCGSLFLSGLSR